MVKRLTAAKVRTAKPGVHGDQFGLRLRVLPSGARTWVWRGTYNGKRVDLGLGGWPVVTVRVCCPASGRSGSIWAART